MPCCSDPLSPLVFSLSPISSLPVLKINTVKVETEAEDAALDCSVNSRSLEKHPLDTVFTALQESSKRKQLSSDSQPESIPSVKRRRLIPEVSTSPSVGSVSSNTLIQCSFSLVGTGSC